MEQPPGPLVDALPYIDQGYDEPGLKEAVFQMIEDETKRYKATKNYLEFLPPVNLTAYETEIMKNEMERIATRQRMELLSMKRYELPEPPPGKGNDINAWIDSVANSEAQLEHQANRIANLNLMNTYGCESWIFHNEILTKMLKKLQGELDQLKKDLQEINWQRKRVQTTTGEKLNNLEASWVGFVSKNFEIERACVQLEHEISKFEEQVKNKQQSEDSETPPEESETVQKEAESVHPEPEKSQEEETEKTEEQEGAKE